jgi:hypothetical protein
MECPYSIKRKSAFLLLSIKHYYRSVIWAGHAIGQAVFAKQNGKDAVYLGS